MKSVRYSTMFVVTLTIFLLSGCQGGSNNPLVSEEIVSPATVDEKPKPVNEEPKPADENNTDNACSPEKPEGTCAEGLACVDGSCVAVAQEPADTDGDGVPDERDNCITVANPEQEETYGSKEQGDACDFTDVEQACKKHAKWWKIDDYEKWKRDPAAYGVACTIFVDASTRVTAEDGSASRPYSLIQSAVNKAVAGDVICVKPGVYREHASEKDDFIGLWLNKGGKVDAPLVLAGIGNGAVVIEGGFDPFDPEVRDYWKKLNPAKKSYDIGIYVNNLTYDGVVDFATSPSFIEIHGLTVRNFKVHGLAIRGSCVMLADSTIEKNGRAYPRTFKEAFETLAGFNNPLRQNKVDDDGDGLVDEWDETDEKENLERAGVYAWGAFGHIIRNNDIVDNGGWYKNNCMNDTEEGCAIRIDPALCKNAPPEYAPPGVSSLGRMLPGSGMYIKTPYNLIEDNFISRNAGSGLNMHPIRDTVIRRNLISENGGSCYSVGAYKDGNMLYEGNTFTGSGVCTVSPAFRSAIYIGAGETKGGIPDSAGYSPENIRLIDNIFRHNNTYELCLESAPKPPACSESFVAKGNVIEGVGSRPVICRCANLIGPEENTIIMPSTGK